MEKNMKLEEQARKLHFDSYDNIVTLQGHGIDMTEFDRLDENFKTLSATEQWSLIAAEARKHIQYVYSMRDENDYEDKDDHYDYSGNSKHYMFSISNWQTLPEDGSIPRLDSSLSINRHITPIIVKQYNSERTAIIGFRQKQDNPQSCMIPIDEDLASLYESLVPKNDKCNRAALLAYMIDLSR